MEHETTDNFRWALEKFKELLFDDQVQLTILTDRELALMNALEVLFPITAHLLCRWHISYGVDKKGKVILPKDENDAESERTKLKKILCKIWDEIVYSSTEEEYESKLYSLEQEWMDWPGLYEYVESSWLPYKEKFVSVWTDKVFHIGNISTNRVESAHSNLKDSLLKDIETHFLSMFNLVNDSIDIQISEIKKSFTMSMNNHHHSHMIALFKDIRGNTSNSCLQVLKNKLKKVDLGCTYPEACGCILVSTHGLPCACRMVTIEREKISLVLSDLHPFWRNLSVEPHRMEIDDLEYHEEYVFWVSKYKESNSHVKKYMLHLLRDVARPQTSWLTTPLEPAKTKGRPQKKPK